MVDRAKDMIITGGENVYSVEVEAVLSKHPGVDEVAVFGVPDERWGEAVHAVVVGRADPEALREHCRTALAGFKVPRVIEVRDEPLPKSGAGKLLKNRAARAVLGGPRPSWWADGTCRRRTSGVDRVPDRARSCRELLVAEPVQEQLPDPGEVGLVGGPERR